MSGTRAKCDGWRDDMIYLDHNGSTPLADGVREAMLPYLEWNHANPSGVHRAARMARDAIEKAREQVAALVNAHPGQVIFTSGATEANNLALQGWFLALEGPFEGATASAGGRRMLAVSTVEHASVLETARTLARRGATLVTIPVDKDGRVETARLERILADIAGSAEPAARVLVSVMSANNETGVIQDLAMIAARARAAGAWLHTDAAQAAGKIALDFAASGVHLMSLSAHKINGPKGAGALVVDRTVPLAPLHQGGGHERGLRAGTENVAAIAGFGAAAEIARRELAARQARLAALRGYLEERLRALPEVVLFAEAAPRLPNTVCLAVPGLDGETLVMRLDRRDIALSSGANCSEGKGEPSHVLLAMGIPPELARCAVRVSLGLGNTRADVDAFIDALAEEIGVLSAPAAAWAAL